MAKKKRSGSAGEASAEPAARPGRGGLATTVVIAMVALGGAGAGYAAWHKRNHPSHQWAMRFQQARAEKLERRLEHCFGGTDGATLRRMAPDLRNGVWPDPFKHCAGSVMTEMVASPMDLEADLRSPPDALENVRARERGKLEHLRVALDVLQRASAYPRTAPVPDSARDGILTTLEDAAVDVDAERQAFGDLLDTADHDSSLW